MSNLRIGEFNMSKSTDLAIEIKNVSKTFKLYMDKANTLKEKILFLKERRLH